MRTGMNNRHCLAVYSTQKLWGLRWLLIQSHSNNGRPQRHCTPCRSDKEALFYALAGCLSKVQASIFRLLDSLEWVLPWLCRFLEVDLVERVAGKTRKDRRCRYLTLLETILGTTRLTFQCCDGAQQVYSWDFQHGLADSPTSRYARSMSMPWYRGPVCYFFDSGLVPRERPLEGWG